MNFTTKAVEALTLQRNGQFQKKLERSMVLLVNPTKVFAHVCTSAYSYLVCKNCRKRTIHFYNKIKYFGVNILFKRVHKNPLH